MKTSGVSEVSLALRRVRRLHALGRVQRPDAEFIEERLEAVIARIVQMPETNEEGVEI